MTIYAYARVSSDGQTLDVQIAALKAAGAEKVFSEKVSGTVTDRKALGKALATLGQGDVLVVTRLDRLARSTRDLLNVLATIAERGAGFRSLNDQWADTTTWEADDHDPRRPRRVRAVADTGADRGRQNAGDGSWGSLRQEAKTNRIPDRRGDPAP
jgi:hypothetical protein